MPRTSAIGEGDDEDEDEDEAEKECCFSGCDEEDDKDEIVGGCFCVVFGDDIVTFLNALPSWKNPESPLKYLAGILVSKKVARKEGE